MQTKEKSSFNYRTEIIFRQSPRKWSRSLLEDFALLGNDFVTTHENESCFQLLFSLPLSSVPFNLLLGVNGSFLRLSMPRGRRICRETIIKLAFLALNRDYRHALTSKTNFSALHGPKASTWLIRLLSFASRNFSRPESSHHTATQSRD